MGALSPSLENSDAIAIDIDEPRLAYSPLPIYSTNQRHVEESLTKDPSTEECKHMGISHYPRIASSNRCGVMWCH